MSEISRVFNEAFVGALLDGRSLYNPEWTEANLRPLRPVAEYDPDWTFPVLYTECRRQWSKNGAHDSGEVIERYSWLRHSCGR